MKFTNVKQLIIKFMGGGLINFPTRFLRWVKINGDTEADDGGDGSGDTTDEISNLIKILTFGQCTEYEVEESENRVEYIAKIPTNIPSVQVSHVNTDLILPEWSGNGVYLNLDQDYNPHIELNNTQLRIEDLLNYEYVIFGNKNNISYGYENNKGKFITIPVILKRTDIDIDTNYIYFTGQNWSIECMSSEGYIQAYMDSQNIIVSVEH